MKTHYIMNYSGLIAFLNIFDGFATHFGLMNHFIEELNPLMNFLMEISPFLFLAVKIGLSVLIVFVSYLVYKKTKKRFQQLYVISLVGVFGIYIGIFCLHLFWMSIL